MAYGDNKLMHRLQVGIWPIMFWVGLLLALAVLAAFQLTSAQPANAVGPALVAWFPALNLLRAIKSYRASKTQN